MITSAQNLHSRIQGSLSIVEMTFSPLGTKIPKRKRRIKFRSSGRKNWWNKHKIPCSNNLLNRRSQWTTTSLVNCFWRWNVSRRSTSWPSGREAGLESSAQVEWVVAGFRPCSNPPTSRSLSSRSLQYSIKQTSWMSITLTWALLSRPQRHNTSSLKACRKLSMRGMLRISSF